MSKDTRIARESLAHNTDAGRTNAILHCLDAIEALEHYADLLDAAKAPATAPRSRTVAELRAAIEKETGDE